MHHLEDRKECGLELEVSINDSGAGLMKGIPQAFPDVEIQADTFHAAYDMGKEVSKLERKAQKLINDESKLIKKANAKKPRAENIEALEEIEFKVTEAIRVYDCIYILFIWLKELLSFSGYSITETLLLAEWVLQEMELLVEKESGMYKECAKVRKQLPSLLSFIKRLEIKIEVAAKETGIPEEAFRLMYRQRVYGQDSPEYNEIIQKQVELLGSRYEEAREVFSGLIKGVKKASSLVENLNGRIRVFIEVKRVIPIKFFVLLKVYFNTRRYKRSRYKERVGKSPIELLTGCDHPEFLEALGY